MSTDLDSFGPDDPVLVSPRYLAGPGLEQRPLAVAMVWSSLTNAGWSTHTPDNGPLLCTSPCQMVRAARMPNSTDRGWKTVVYEDPLAAPWWTAEWTQQTPVELLTDFHRALAEAHATGALHSLTSPTAAVYVPLLNGGWSHMVDERGNQSFTSPDRLARVTGHRRPSHGGDAWIIDVSPGTTGHCRWTARFSKQVPNALVAAFTASLADTTPVYRGAGTLPKELGSYLVTEPAPPCAPGRSEAAAPAPLLPPAGPGQSTAHRR
ncbi:DUF317 domain-containing protein [Streptomyces niveus]|uniref:DUF317 domain-containing protein n=1 Tax=Streptomyces niveus TaxID=193462 RepID=UPI0033ED0FFB